LEQHYYSEILFIAMPERNYETAVHGHPPMLNTKKITQVMLMAIALSSLPLYSADLNIGPTTEGNGRFLVNFTVSSYQKTDIIEAIKRGIVVKVVYEIEIVQKSRGYCGEEDQTER
jgi:hypothetical protein